MEVAQNKLKKSEIGLIPEDWELKAISEITKIFVGRDLNESNFSSQPDDNYKYPAFSNTVLNAGLYGYYNVPEYNGHSLTVVGRGVGLGTAFVRKGAYGAIGRLLVLFPKGNVDARYLAAYINNRVKIFTESGGIPQLTGASLGKYLIPVPNAVTEQTAIATALSDIDTLIENLEKLIAKKRNIKQGVMQELLKPKSNWILTSVDEVAKICKGEQLNKDTLAAQGEYPVMNGGIQPSGYSEKWNQNPNTIIISEGGNSCGYVNFIKTRFWQGGHCYLVDAKIHKHFLYHLLKFHEKEIMGLRVGSGLPNIQRNRLIEFSLSIPDRENQHKIASVLDGINEEITTMEHKLHKYRMIKQGMMQTLLTGKIRLI